jgi:polyribonucleotide nucleotidyltransferase
MIDQISVPVGSSPEIQISKLAKQADSAASPGENVVLATAVLTRSRETPISSADRRSARNTYAAGRIPGAGSSASRPTERRSSLAF